MVLLKRYCQNTKDYFGTIIYKHEWIKIFPDLLRQERVVVNIHVGMYTMSALSMLKLICTRKKRRRIFCPTQNLSYILVNLDHPLKSMQF